MSGRESGPVLDIKKLSVLLPDRADRRFAIRDVNISIDPGTTLCVVGESGSGKSVLANAVMGLLPKGLTPAGGSIRLDGEELLLATPRRMRALRGQGVGMVFQEPMTALNPVMRCGDQVDELLREHTNWGSAQRRREILAIFDQVRLPEPERIFRSFPHQLSGGQRQRIVIAMAAILKPRLLICDEPTTALDVTTQKEILRLIDRLHREQGCAVLFITHDMGVVAEIADNVLVMRSGEPVEYGSRESVLRQPTAQYTRDLLAAIPSMQPPPARARVSTLPVFKAKGVEKTYVSHHWTGKKRETHALKGIDLELAPGEIVGIVGESGCGKSTFARCAVRLIEPSAGTLTWEHDEVQHLHERQLRPLRSAVQIIFQDPNRSLNPRRTVGDSIVEGAINFGATTQEATALAESLMARVRLPVKSLKRYPSEFSGGQRQRIAIARALACRPKVLVADEAVSALDVSVQADIIALLKEIRSAENIALLFITHDLRVAAQLCDRVVVMHAGVAVEHGKTSEVYAAPKHEYTKALFAAAPTF